MKKSTVRVTVVFLILIIGVVGYYTYLSQRSKKASENAAFTKIQNALSRDLKKDYPPSPKEVIKYFVELEKCLYNEECTTEEIQQLGVQMRELYDEELQKNNAVEDYIPRLRTEVESFHEEEKRILSISVPDSLNVDYFSEDGFEFARLYCKYSVMEKGKTSQMEMVYLLRQDDNRRWKIYGWERSDKLETPEEGSPKD